MDRENLRTHLIRGCALMCIEINSHQVEQLLKFAKLVEAGNRQMNLTRITSEAEFAVKQWKRELDFSEKSVKRSN